MFSLLLAIIYIAFVSLGLPDAVLGSAWPIMRLQFAVSVDYAGYIQMIIAFGTILSSFASAKITQAIGSGKLTSISVFFTAVSIFGFSISGEYWQILIWAIPYGLGAGGVDAALNNYVAIHYSSSHMSWLHAMWGIGASLGPIIMSFALARDFGWQGGYRIIAICQMILTAILFFTLPLWKEGKSGLKAKELKKEDIVADDNKSLNNEDDNQTLQKMQESKANKSIDNSKEAKYTTLDILKTPGVIPLVISFFAYCALEVTTGLWMSSYLVLGKGMPEPEAAGWASLFYIGITVGRIISGFVAYKLNDTQSITWGASILALGIVFILLSTAVEFSLLGFILIGLGCAPIYPSIIHSTPTYFGAEKSKFIVGFEMAFAYMGNLLLPTAFGQIADYLGIYLLPWFLIALFLLFAFSYVRLLAIDKVNRKLEI